MLLSDDLPTFRRDITASHSSIEKIGMEGGTTCFDTLYVSSQSRKAMITIARAGPLGRGGNDEPAEAGPTSPGTLLPEITWEQEEKHCSDCNNPTHLHWKTGKIEWWLCQGCAKRRGDPYALTIRAFTSFFEAKAKNWLMKRILV